MHAHAGRRAAAKSRSNRRDIRRQALSIMESLEPRTLMSSTVLGTAAAGGDYASIKYTEDDTSYTAVLTRTRAIQENFDKADNTCFPLGDNSKTKD